MFKRHPATTALVVLLLVWSFFARPMYDFLWITAGRVKGPGDGPMGPAAPAPGPRRGHGRRHRAGRPDRPLPPWIAGGGGPAAPAGGFFERGRLRTFAGRTAWASSRQSALPATGRRNRQGRTRRGNATRRRRAGDVHTAAYPGVAGGGKHRRLHAPEESPTRTFAVGDCRPWPRRRARRRAGRQTGHPGSLQPRHRPWRARTRLSRLGADVRFLRQPSA